MLYPTSGSKVDLCKHLVLNTDNQVVFWTNNIATDRDIISESFLKQSFNESDFMKVILWKLNCHCEPALGSDNLLTDIEIDNQVAFCTDNIATDRDIISAWY